jgi:hypothetical protein
MKNKSLDELRQQVKQLDMLIRTAELGEDYIFLKDKKFTTAELKDWRDDVKGEIASRISQTKLKLVKK